MLKTVSRRLLRDEAYGAIRDAIVSGVLGPGEQIRDGELSAQIGLSRTPVREALARLAQEGLVESFPNSSTRVTPLVKSDALDAYLVLLALHSLAVELAVPRLSVHDFERLDDANARFEAALDLNDVAGALVADDAFHGVFVEVSGNRVLRDTIERYTPLVRRLEHLRFSSLPGRQSVESHAAIVEAASASNREQAVRLTRDNWSTLGDEIDNAFSRGDDDTAGEEPPVRRRSARRAAHS